MGLRKSDNLIYAPGAFSLAFIKTKEHIGTVASSNAEAVFSIDATATAEQNADKLGAQFTDLKANTVKVTAKLLNATGYVTSTQTATVHFSKTNTNISVAFEVPW